MRQPRMTVTAVARLRQVSAGIFAMTICAANHVICHISEAVVKK